MAARELAALFGDCAWPVVVLRRGRVGWANPAMAALSGGVSVTGRTVDALVPGGLPDDASEVDMSVAGEVVRFARAELRLGAETWTVLRGMLTPPRAALPASGALGERPMWDLLETAGVGLWLVDAAGRTLLCNRAGQDLLGATADEIHRSSVQDLLGLGVGPPLEGTHLVERERANGVRAEVELVLSPMPLEEGEPPGAVALLRDVTSTRQVLRELRDASAVSRAAMDAVPVPCMVSDARGVVWQSNRAALAWLDQRDDGRPRAPLQLADVLGVDLAQAVLGGAGAERGSTHEGDIKGAGGMRSVRVHALALRGEGPIHTAVVVEPRVSSALPGVNGLDAERLVAALGELVQGTLLEVHHELGGVDDPRAIHSAEAVRSLGQRVATSLQAARDHARVMVAPPLEPVAVLRVLQRAVQFAGVPGALGAGPIPVASVLGNEVLLARAVAQLLRNAAQHGGPDANPTLRAHAVGGELVEVVVEDRGPGMPAHLREPALRFLGLPPVAGRVRTGLAWVQQVVNAHGGRVELDDVLPTGLRVVLRLRAAASQGTTGKR